MKIGDLVVYVWPEFLGNADFSSWQGVGIVYKIEDWHDKNAPEITEGKIAWVQWPNGTCNAYESSELSVVTHIQDYGVTK